MNRTHLRRAIAAFLVAAVLLAACGDDDAETDAASDTTEAGTDGHGHGAMEGREVGDWDIVPTVDLEATPDGDGSVALDINTTGFVFGPEVDDDGAEHVDGEGHLHVYVDGVKVARIHTDEYRLDDLTPGDHDITVGLNGNDHRPWLVDGEPIEASRTVTVAGETPDAGTETIEVTVAGGAVTGGGRHDVSLGDTVSLSVTSDVADHVHLHGYDVMVDVGPGEPAELTFDATIPGVFEVELEESGVLLLELEIS